MKPVRQKKYDASFDNTWQNTKYIYSYYLHQWMAYFMLKEKIIPRH